MRTPDPLPRPLDHLAVSGARDAPALKVRGEIFSYAQLNEAVGRIATALIQLGLEPGARVAAWLPKSGLACLLPLAAARAGLVYVPINPVLKPAQVRHILVDSGASAYVVSADLAAVLGPEMGSEAGRRILDADLQLMAQTAPVLPPSQTDPDQLCQLLYTSGSTGHPKGVMLSHANLWLGAESVACYLDLHAQDRCLAVLPLSFDYGQNQLLSIWRAGGLAIAHRYVLPQQLVAAAVRDAATVLAGVPLLWSQMVRADWPNGFRSQPIRLTNSGGAMTPALVQALRRVFPSALITPMYGLTEAFRATFLDPDLVDTHPSSIGRPIPFAQIHLVRPDGSPVRGSEPGELVQSGPLVALGYWNQPEASRARFRSAPYWTGLSGRSVWSGDRVWQDADGLCYFLGRADDMIKSAGYRISPSEIEDIALAQDGVSAAVALGIADADRGQTIVLHLAGDADCAAVVRQKLEMALPAFMQPDRLVWHAALPTTPNGKPDRQALRALGGKA